MRTVAWLVIAIIVGFYLGHIFTIPPKSECVTGKVEFGLANIVIGEAVVCGEFHSGVYGPTLEVWGGEIKFYHDHEE